MTNIDSWYGYHGLEEMNLLRMFILFYLIIEQEYYGLLRQTDLECGNQQRCLHFRLLLEDSFEQLSGIVKNVDRYGRTALFLIMTDSCLRAIQVKTKAVRRRKSVNNATISYMYKFL